MLGRRRVGSGVLIGVLTAALLGPVGPAAAGPAAGGGAAGANAAGGMAAAAGSAKTGRPHTVTLLTGDRVTLADGGKVGIHRGEGRTDVTFLTKRVDGHVHVIPSDALPLLRAGRLDPRLFDLTALVAFGYDDARGDLPLIVTADSAAARSRAKSTVTAEGTRVVRELPAVDGLAVRADKTSVAGLWDSLTGSARPGTAARSLAGGVSAVWLDGLRQPSLDVSVPQIGAPAAWEAGLRGGGVKVAVLDTGIDDTHPDLAGQVGAASNFTEGEEDDLDRVGHGTHVASTIAGTGAASDGRYTGVAPEATLLDGKVCVEYGCADSWILAGMQWAAEQGAKVVNMSLGGWDTPEVDPVEQAVENLTDQYGTLFVVAAGNDGMDATINSPASADAALAVGAVTKTDELAEFSSRGPRIDGGLKPDITAPGAEIVAANSKDGFLGTPGEPYTTLSGTSMATPHVAGAAAILAQRRPDLRAEALKAVLMGSAEPNPELSAFAQGAGRVDVARAVTQEVSADPPSVGFGRQLWPHADDTPVARTVTYRNAADRPVTLALSTQATGPTGRAAPAGFFTLSATSLTVPAGGEASVTVTADTRVDGPDGHYTGRLTATAGGTSVVTPFAVDREVESYDITVRHLDREGGVPLDYATALLRLDAPGWIDLYDPDGTVEVRVPKGTYTLMSLTFTGEPDAEEVDMTFLSRPKLSVAGELTLTVDSRKGRPMSVTVPRRDATAVGVDVSAEVTSGDLAYGWGVGGGTFDGFYTAQLGPDRSFPGFRSYVGATLAKVDAEGDPMNSPFAYMLSWKLDGRMPTGFTRKVKPAALATVRSVQATQGPGLGDKFTFPVYPAALGSSAFVLAMDLPFERVEYYNTGSGVQWQGNFMQYLEREEEEEFVVLASLWGANQRYRAGRTYAEQWNRGVFSPSLVDPVFPAEYVSRVGDQLIVVAPTHSDGDHRYGLATLDSARVTVHRDGVKVGEAEDFSGEFEVPAAAGRYRVEVVAERGAPARLSTRVSTAWTFRSGTVAAEEPVRLPVSVVRFRPDLSRHNTAPAGRAFTVPVTVQPQEGSRARPCAALTVQVSYDDGRTWAPARVTGSGAQRQLHLTHPDRAGFVSLRASARDTAGNTVEQTIIRAYQIVR